MGLSPWLLFAAVGGAVVAAPAGPRPPGTWNFATPFEAPGPVYQFVQDTEGLLWAASAAGLLRFDGRDVTTIDPAGAGFESSYAYHVVIDARGRVVVAMGGRAAACEPGPPTAACVGEMPGSDGLFVLGSDQRAFVAGEFPRIERVRGPRIHALAAVGDGVWAASRAELFRLVGHRLEPLPLPVAMGSPFVTALVSWRDGVLVGTLDGVWYLSGTSAVRVLNAAPVQALMVDAGQRAWIGTARGLFRLEDTASAPVPEPGEADVRSLHVDARGTGWVGTADGLARVDALAPASDALAAWPDRRVLAVGSDREGGVWVGLRTGGVRRGSRIMAANHGATGRWLPPAVAVLVTRDGSVWAADRTGRLQRRRDGKVEIIDSPGATSEPSALAEAPDGALWMATRGAGLNRWQGSDWQHVDAGLGPILDFLLIERGGAVWTGGAAGLARGQPKVSARGIGFEATSVPGSRPAPCDGAPVAAAEDAAGRVWMSIQGGYVAVHDGKSWRCLNTAGVEATELGSVLPRSDGSVWLASPNRGLVRLKDGAFRALSEADGLPCDAVTDFIDATDGHLWYTCGLGAVQVRWADLEARLAGRSTAIPAVLIGRRDGLVSAESNTTARPVLARDRLGHTWVATTGPLVQLADPAHVPPQPPPRSRIARILVDGVVRRPDGQGEIAVRAARVTLKAEPIAAVLAFGRGACFRQRLTGHRDDWERVVPGIAITHAGIEPGSHRLEVQAGTDDCSRWETGVAAVSLIVHPPWTRTPGFWAASVGLVLLAGFSLHMTRLRLVARRFAAVEQERQRIARDLHDGLGQGFTALRFHLEALRTDADGPLQRRNELLTRTLDVLGQVQNEARSTIWSLRAGDLGVAPLPEALGKLARTLPQGSTPRVLVEAQLNVRLEPLIEGELVQVAREALTNALRHARPRTVTIHVEADDDELRLSVADDGTGFVVAPEEAVAQGRFGILGMRERLRRLGGVLAIDTSPGQGTTVLAVVPLRRSGEASREEQQRGSA